MLAIQMKETLFRDDMVDIWISDHSMGASTVAERIKKFGEFHDTRYIETKGIVYSRGIMTKLHNLIKYGNGLDLNEEWMDYEEVIFHGISIFVYGLYISYMQKKRNVEWSLFEEGIFSYGDDCITGKSVKFLDFMCHVHHKKTIQESIKQYYCVFPELYKKFGFFETVRVPDFRSNYDHIRELLTKIFGIANNTHIEQKYIYFATSSDVDGHPYGETQVVIKLIELLGRENIIIKKHPRDCRDIYNDNRINVMESTGIPWEIVQMCSDTKSKVFVTVDSGAFLGISAMIDDDTEGFFIFPLFTGKRSKVPYYHDRDKKIELIVSLLHETGKCMNIRIVNSIDYIKC